MMFRFREILGFVVSVALLVITAFVIIWAIYVSLPPTYPSATM